MRAGKVARGGIRWSDRKEDFRTEILGLMKAQTVKNAVIVPGRVERRLCRQAAARITRESAAEGVECYKTLIRGLLDLTDNIVAEEPGDVGSFRRRRSSGTMMTTPTWSLRPTRAPRTFSDFANAISEEYGFWLGDAFASGGSAGYDHKADGHHRPRRLGARQAPFSRARTQYREQRTHCHRRRRHVRRRVRQRHADVATSQAARRLRSPACLCRPRPDAEHSFAERLRLFRLPRSSWADYDRALISPGGGVFERSAKSVPISPEMKRAFDIEADHLTPAELIRQC